MLKLSVIIATFNRASALMRTLDSLLEQSLDSKLWEVVVIDNNSGDDTSECMSDYIAEHKAFNIKYVFESEQGLSSARNAGISEAKGEYLVIVDDDEIFAKDFLTAYYSLFEREQSAMVAGGRVEPLYEFELPKWMGSIVERPIAGTVNFSAKTKFFPSSRYPTGGNMAFRASVFQKCGVFNTSLGRKGQSLMGGEEKDMFERVNEPIYYVYDALMYHIIPQSRVSVEYVYKVSDMIGKSERLRTKARGIYAQRLFSECIKWAGTLAFSLYYIICGRFSAAKVLCGLRLRITQGLIKKGA